MKKILACILHCLKTGDEENLKRLINKAYMYAKKKANEKEKKQIILFIVEVYLLQGKYELVKSIINNNKDIDLSHYKTKLNFYLKKENDLIQECKNKKNLIHILGDYYKVIGETKLSEETYIEIEANDKLKTQKLFDLYFYTNQLDKCDKIYKEKNNLLTTHQMEVYLNYNLNVIKTLKNRIQHINKHTRASSDSKKIHSVFFEIENLTTTIKLVQELLSNELLELIAVKNTNNKVYIAESKYAIGRTLGLDANKVGIITTLDNEVLTMFPKTSHFSEKHLLDSLTQKTRS